MFAAVPCKQSSFVFRAVEKRVNFSANVQKENWELKWINEEVLIDPNVWNAQVHPITCYFISLLLMIDRKTRSSCSVEFGVSSC